MADQFLLVLPWTLVQEGRPGTKASDWVNPDGTINETCWDNPENFSNDRHDPGGKTFCGIIQREYDLWRKGHGLPVQDVRNLKAEEGVAIYQISYWLPHAPSLPPGLNLGFFDEAVNTGPFEAIKVLQSALGVDSDGIWGPQTSAAVTLAADKLEDSIKAFVARRAAVYREMRGFEYFGKDWLNRTNEIGSQMLVMAKQFLTV